MAQLIDKSALVTEIERLKTIYNDDKNIHYVSRFNILVDLLSFIDTLEVKEVDLKEEIEKCLKQHNMLAVGKKYFTDIAKHFFELGLKAQKGEEV